MECEEIVDFALAGKMKDYARTNGNWTEIITPEGYRILRGYDACIIIIAKKALSYLEKDTYTAKHIVETMGKEYPVAGAFSDIQIADAAIEKCWEWIETKNFAVLDDFEKIVDGGDWHADLVQIQWDAPEQEQGIWACVINCVCYCYRIGEEHLDGIISQFLEICGTELYGWTLDDYSKINPAYAREIDEIEKFFVANYSEGSEKKVCKEDVKRFYEN